MWVISHPVISARKSSRHYKSSSARYDFVFLTQSNDAKTKIVAIYKLVKRMKNEVE